MASRRSENDMVLQEKNDITNIATNYTRNKGERLNGIQEVSGSIPLISTTKRKPRHPSWFSFCLSPETRLNLRRVSADYSLSSVPSGRASVPSGSSAAPSSSVMVGINAFASLPLPRCLI